MLLFFVFIIRIDKIFIWEMKYMAQSAKKDLTLLHALITVFLMFGFAQVVPPLGSITPYGMKILGIFIGLLYGWTASNLIWPTFLGMIALVSTGAFTMKEFFALSFGNETVVFLMVLFVFTGLVDAVGLIKFIANWFVSRKCVNGRPWVFSTLVIFGAFVAGGFINMFAALIVFWGIIYIVSDMFGFKPYDKYPTLMIFGVIFMAQIGFCVFPFKVVVYMLLGVFKTISGLQVDFLKYFLFTFPLGLIILCAFVLLCRFVLRPDVSHLYEITPERFAQKLTLNGEQKIGIGFLMALFVLLFLPSVLPDGTALKTMLNTVGSSGTIMVILGLLTIWQYQHKPLIDFGQAAAKGVGWDTIIITVTILPVCNILTADVTGIKAFLVAQLGPMLSGRSAMVFSIVIIAIAMITTNILNNAVVGIILLSITFSLSATIPINSIAIAALIIFCAHIAIVTPAASIYGALLYSNGDWIKPRDGYKYGFITVLMTLILTATIGLAWANFIF